MNEEHGHISDAFDMLPDEDLLMNEEQQELYDIIADWWDSVFVAPSVRGRDACLTDLVNSIMEWRNRDEYVEDPWNLRPRQPMEPVWKTWEEPKRSPVEGQNE